MRRCHPPAGKRGGKPSVRRRHSGVAVSLMLVSPGVRWGGAEGRVPMRAVRLAGAHSKVSARESEVWHVQVGECAVVVHLRASARHAVNKEACITGLPCRLRWNTTVFIGAAPRGACRLRQGVWPARTTKSSPVEVSCGTPRLTSAILEDTCGRARGMPSVRAQHGGDDVSLMQLSHSACK